jgi:hypothetical protein
MLRATGGRAERSCIMLIRKVRKVTPLELRNSLAYMR